MNALKKDKYTNFVSKKKNRWAKRAERWTGKGGRAPPFPSPDLSSVRFARRDFWLSPIFLPPISLTAEPGPMLKDLKPKKNTENQKGLEIGKIEKCERMVLWKAWKTTALLFSFRSWFGLLNTSFSPVPAINVYISLWCCLLIKFAFRFLTPLLFRFSRRLGRNCCLDFVSSTPWFRKEESLVP